MTGLACSSRATAARRSPTPSERSRCSGSSPAARSARRRRPGHGHAHAHPAAAERLGRAVADLHQPSELHAGRLRIDFRLTARIVHRRLARLVGACVLPVETEGDRLEVMSPLARISPASRPTPGRSRVVIRSWWLAVNFGMGAHRGRSSPTAGVWKTCKFAVRISSRLMPSAWIRSQYALARRAVGGGRLRDGVGLGVDGHEDAGEIRLQLRLRRFP